MVFNLALIVPLQHAGLALATSLSAYLNAFLLYRGLRREGVYQPGAGWPRVWLWLVVGLVDMAVLLWFIVPPLDYWLTADTLPRALGLVAWIIAGGVVYFLSMLLLGMRVRHLRGQL
jgi:putative peptidoglycan lipid II flippase